VFNLGSAVAWLRERDSLPTSIVSGVSDEHARRGFRRGEDDRGLGKNAHGAHFSPGMQVLTRACAPCRHVTLRLYEGSSPSIY